MLVITNLKIKLHKKFELAAILNETTAYAIVYSKILQFWKYREM